MKKRKLWSNGLAGKTKKTVASVLALSMALSGGAYATTRSGSTADAMADAISFVNGDVDGNGKVELADAQLALKGALKIWSDYTELQFYAADVDSNNKLELNDAQMILKAALKINQLPEKPAPTTEPSGSEEPVVPTGGAVTEEPGQTKKPAVTNRPTIPPTYVPASSTPRPSLEPVEAKEENIVTDYTKVEAVDLNLAQSVVTGSGVDTYTQYVFGPMNADEVSEEAIKAASFEAVEEVLSKDGIEMQNTYKGRTDLQEKVQDVIRTERINGKPTVWELTGAAIVTESGLALSEMDQRVSNAEPQGYKFCDEENIDYTMPEWTKGVSYSFWAYVTEDNAGCTALTIQNDQVILAVKLNGTVRFLDSTSTKERNSLYLQSDQIVDGFTGWAYYTVTIKNDWIQVYVNGQENVYTQVSMDRGTIQMFNDGFLTRYNPLKVVTQEMVDNDVRHYYTTASSGNKAPWYKNPDTGVYEGHDDYSIFVNNRFRGAAKGGTLLMDFITDDTTKVWLGGVSGAVDEVYTKRGFAMDVNMADFRTYETELTAEQVAACYEYTAVTPEALIVWDVNNVPKVDDSVTNDKTPVLNVNKWAEYDEESDIVTFKEPTGRADKVTGVELENPFTEKTELVETIYDALSGQAIFPYLKDNGGTVDGIYTDRIGCTAWGAQVMGGNFYDVWYGDPGVAGYEMDPATGTTDPTKPASELMTIDELEAAYGDQKVTYQRPVWNEGLSVSFWAKPVEVDDSPLLTFYKAQNMLLTVSVRGDVAFYSLNANDWSKGIASNSKCLNSFSATGDGSYVKAGEWNYYTLTVANDYITVYVNGQEQVYSSLNLNRGYCKSFNKGYLTRYNTIGIWTTDMVERYGDPSNADGVERNYLIKSGYMYDLNDTTVVKTDSGLMTAISPDGVNRGKDSASIRSNGVYMNPYLSASTTRTLMEIMTDSKVKLYFGGVPSVISLDKKYTFQDLRVTEEQAADEEYMSKVHGYGLTYSDEEETTESSESRCKFFFSDHILDEGTQMTGLYSDMKELTADEVAAKYQSALSNKPQ